MPTTLYDLLEVSQNASPQVIRAAYKTLMQRYHPDKNPDDPTVVKLAVAVGQAFDVLSDPEKRAAYDRDLGAKNASRTQQPPTTSPTQYREQPVTKVATGANRKSDLPFWLLVGTVLVAIGFFVSTEEKPTVIAPTAEEARLNSQRWEAIADEARQNAAKEAQKTESQRTVENLMTNVKVFMPPNTEGNTWCDHYSKCPHFIEIPSVGVVLSENNAIELMSTLKKNRSLVIEAVKNKLHESRYTELTTVDGAKKLEAIIMDSVNQSLTGNPYRHDLGVQKVLLPGGFNIK